MSTTTHHEYNQLIIDFVMNWDGTFVDLCSWIDGIDEHDVSADQRAEAYVYMQGVSRVF